MIRTLSRPVAPVWRTALVALLALALAGCGGQAAATVQATSAATASTGGGSSATTGAATASTSTTLAPTAAAAPPAATAVPPTNTPASPTAAPATSTPIPPTPTVAPPTATPSPRPAPLTATPRAPTATPRPAAAAPPDPAAVARGKAIFTSSVGCGLCHTIDGLTNGDQGPNLTHIASQPIPSPPWDKLPNDPAFLRRWITNPQAIKPGTIMPDLGLSSQEVNDLVAFLETQR